MRIIIEPKDVLRHVVRHLKNNTMQGADKTKVYEDLTAPGVSPLLLDILGVDAGSVRITVGDQDKPVGPEDQPPTRFILTVAVEEEGKVPDVPGNPRVEPRTMKEIMDACDRGEAIAAEEVRYIVRELDADPAKAAAPDPAFEASFSETMDRVAGIVRQIYGVSREDIIDEVTWGNRLSEAQAKAHRREAARQCAGICMSLVVEAREGGNPRSNAVLREACDAIVNAFGLDSLPGASRRSDTGEEGLDRVAVFGSEYCPDGVYEVGARDVAKRCADIVMDFVIDGAESSPPSETQAKHEAVNRTLREVHAAINRHFAGESGAGALLSDLATKATGRAVARACLDIVASTFGLTPDALRASGIWRDVEARFGPFLSAEES